MLIATPHQDTTATQETAQTPAAKTQTAQEDTTAEAAEHAKHKRTKEEHATLALPTAIAQANQAEYAAAETAEMIMIQATQTETATQETNAGA